jgi:aspartyl-tRNA(Asn)/glutamyl-tRNA(Gln) amidotransferase subunit B
VTWEVVVGIETHAQLLTKSKIFSGAATAFGAQPNTQASAVDIALPGVLPVLNRRAVELAIRFGLAVRGTVSRRSIFARKNYFYPDLPKGYQISQYELPVVQGGSIEFLMADGERKVRLTRAHLEEDAGKSIHGEALSGVVGQGVVGVMTVGTPLSDEFRDLKRFSAIDLNRAGTPLLEIVSEPELFGSAEAVAYARALHRLVKYIGVCDGNMQEGSFRCDANVSVRRKGDRKLGTRCEIKNLNSFAFMQQAIEFEASRQIEVIENGGSVVQETRLFDPDRGETRSMRTKEDAQDYRYFPDPDLLPLVITEEQIERVRNESPELPSAVSARFKNQYGLSDYDARALTADRSCAEYFEEVARLVSDKKAAANWVIGEVLARLNQTGDAIENARATPKETAGFINMVLDGEANLTTAKKMFDELWNKTGSFTITPSTGSLTFRGELSAMLIKRGLVQISDTEELERIVEQVIAKNPKQVGDYRGGKDKALNFLVGQVMKTTKGTADATQVSEILRRKLVP